jgi:hypothetical protein
VSPAASENKLQIKSNADFQNDWGLYTAKNSDVFMAYFKILDEADIWSQYPAEDLTNTNAVP